MDPRAQHSRFLLHQALQALIVERGWARFSVSDLCKRAGVARSTFYIHFGDIEDLLISGLDTIAEHLVDHISRLSAAARPPFAFLQGMTLHAADSRRWVKIVLGPRTGVAVQHKFRSVIRGLMTEELKTQGVDETQLEARVRFLTGALVELFFWWSENPEDNIDRVEKEFLNLVAKMV